MPSRPTRIQQAVSIQAVAEYHGDAELSFRLFFAEEHNPNFVIRFAGKRPSEVQDELAERLDETDMRSALAILTRIEATFRIDYMMRSGRKGADSISVAFRKLRRSYGKNHWRVPLDKGIFDTWRIEQPGTARLIGELKGAFKFRHWLAHGRYFEPKLARRYDYQTLYVLAENVLAQFPLLVDGAAAE